MGETYYWVVKGTYKVEREHGCDCEFCDHTETKVRDMPAQYVNARDFPTEEKAKLEAVRKFSRSDYSDIIWYEMEGWDEGLTAERGGEDVWMQAIGAPTLIEVKGDQS